MPPFLPLLALLATQPPAPDAAPADDPVIVDRAPLPVDDLPKVAAGIVERTNAFRKAEGRGPLKENAELTAASRSFAEFMVSTGKYGHTADGKRPIDRATDKGYEPCMVAENIAWMARSDGFSVAALADGLEEGWEKSPGHRKNMLDANAAEIGVAVARSAETGKYYGVQMFGRPKSLQFEFRVENRTEKPVEYDVGGAKATVAARTIQTHTLCAPADVAFPGEPPVGVKGGERFVLEVSGDGAKVRRE